MYDVSIHYDSKKIGAIVQIANHDVGSFLAEQLKNKIFSSSIPTAYPIQVWLAGKELDRMLGILQDNGGFHYYVKYGIPASE